VLKNVEQIYELFTAIYTSNQTIMGINEMRVNDTQMSMRGNNEAWSIPEISFLK